MTQQEAFDRLRGVEEELVAVQSSLDQIRLSPGRAATERNNATIARANAERTYLIRLLAEFEGALARLGPDLRAPIQFSATDSLKTKLDRIGKNQGIDRGLRLVVDKDVRTHRNELMHGRSPVPRVSFGRSHDLLKSFLRWCF